jgi:hypothetical protein
MVKKKAFVLRLDPEILKAIEKWSADEFRSTNGQIEWIISSALKNARRYPKNKLIEDKKEAAP